MITFKTTERWNQFVVPRPAIEAGGGRRESCTFLNKLFCWLVLWLYPSGFSFICAQFLQFYLCTIFAVLFVHNFCGSPKSFGQNRHHCHVCDCSQRTITYGSKTYECTFVCDSILWTCRRYTVFVIYFYTQVFFWFRYHLCLLSARSWIISNFTLMVCQLLNTFSRNPLKHSTNYVGYVAIPPTAT